MRLVLKGRHEMLHTETQMSIPPKYQEVCITPDTVTTGSQVSLMQPRSNHDLKYLKYYTLQHLPRGGHPQPYCTIYYGQVQKKQWTQSPDEREDIGWSVTQHGIEPADVRDRPSRWYHNGQKWVYLPISVVYY